MEVPAAFSDDGNTANRRRRNRGEKKVVNGDYYDSADDKQHRSRDGKMSPGAFSLGSLGLNPCLCIFATGRFCCRRCSSGHGQLSFKGSRSQRQWKRNRRDTFLELSVLISFILSLSFFCTYFCPISFEGFRFHHLRPRSDANVDELALVIPIFDFKGSKVDIGGWLFRRITVQPNIKMDPEPESPDHGDLEYESTGGETRAIRDNDYLLYEHYRIDDVLRLGEPEPKTRSRHEHTDEIEDELHLCRRPNWLLLYHPSCNSVYEIDLARDFNENMAKVGDDQIYDTFQVG
jgi:hypothetical protein